MTTEAHSPALTAAAEMAVVAQLKLARDARTEAQERLRVRTMRIATSLGASAALLAAYDTVLLLR